MVHLHYFPALTCAGDRLKLYLPLGIIDKAYISPCVVWEFLIKKPCIFALIKSPPLVVPVLASYFWVDNVYWSTLAEQIRHLGELDLHPGLPSTDPAVCRYLFIQAGESSWTDVTEEDRDRGSVDRGYRCVACHSPTGYKSCKTSNSEDSLAACLFKVLGTVFITFTSKKAKNDS